MNKHFKEVLGKFLSKISSFQKGFINNQNKRKLAFMGGAVLLFVAVLLTIGVGFGIYLKGARGGLVTFWSRVVPYPASLVRWQVISYSEYLNDLVALEHFYARQQEETGLPTPNESVLEKAVMDRMVRNIALTNLSREKEVTVSDEELAEQFKETTAQVGTVEDAEKLLQDLYGWDSQTFINRVLYYFLLEEKLAVSIGNDQQLNDEMTAEIGKLKETRFFGK